MSTAAAVTGARRGPGRNLRVLRATAAALGVVAWLGHAALASAAMGNLAAARADDGAYVVSETPIDAQMLDLTISSPALKGTGMVRLILPHDWSTQPNATWPTLYLINGSNDPVTYKSWTQYTNLESVMAPRDVLTAMPTDGKAGYGSTEVNGGPDYDTFESAEVPQILQRAYRSSGRNAIGGVSSGGFAAMQLAALHPGEYRAAAAYSGLLDSQFPGFPVVIETDLANAGENPDALWGSPIFNYSAWTAHNPRAQVAKLKGVALFVSCGDGVPGPFDSLTNPTIVAGSLLEAPALVDDESFLAAAALAGVPVTTDLYGSGTHSWPYWQREFGRSWPVLAGGLGVPAT